MSKLTQVVNGRYVGANKYTIKDAGGGKSTIDFSPDSVLEQGTAVGAEILNEIQKNGLYYLAGTHKVVGQESIYDCTLIGIDTFDFVQLNVLFKPNVVPTQNTVKLNISGQTYVLTDKITNNNQIGLVLVKSELKAYTWGTKITIVDDLTTGGTDKALSAQMGVELNNKKANKSGDTFTGLIKVKMERPYIEFLNASNERMGYIGYGATDNTKLQIINALKSNGSVSNILEVYNDGSLAIPYETIPNNSVVDANDLIPSQDVGTKIYRISSSSVVTNSSNFPEGAGAGFLRVTRTYNTQITQEYFDTTNNNTYIRYKVSAWYPWVSVDKKHYTIMFAKGTRDSSNIVQSSDSEVTLDIFQHRQFGDGNLAQYDSTDKTIKILKSGRYMINMAIYHLGITGRNSFIFKLYKNDTLIDYTESRGGDIREKKNINLVYDLKANEKLKLTVRNSTGNNLIIYTPKEYSRLQLTKISEIGGL